MGHDDFIYNEAFIVIFIRRMDPFLLFAAFFAGLVDAVAGGGGLIQIPALFTTYSNASPASLLGTNKLASITGTTAAWLRYRHRVIIPWQILKPMLISAFIFSLCGAGIATQIDQKAFRIALPLILSLLFVYVITKPNLGVTHTPRHQEKYSFSVALATGGIIGFYDGLFGPGTGSFLMLAYIRFFGFDFLHASAATKLVNMMTNLAALILFAAQGHIWWKIGLAMAIANVLGGWAGSFLAIKHGNHFVRPIFILVVMALIIKTGIDALSYF